MNNTEKMTEMEKRIAEIERRLCVTRSWRMPPRQRRCAPTGQSAHGIPLSRRHATLINLPDEARMAETPSGVAGSRKEHP